MSEIEVVAAIIIKQNQVLIAKRPNGKHKAGYWEFPGGKIEKGESQKQALCREIKEEINLTLEASELELFQTSKFEYPEKKVCLYFYKTTQYAGTPRGMERQQVQWVELSNLTDYQFPEANLPIVERLTE
jgi:8-oxo-dGTP diphosphatase